MLSVSILLLGVALAVVLLPTQSAWLYVATPFVAIFQGIISPNMASVISAKAEPDRQGELLGINQSMQSLGEIIPPFIAGYLNSLNFNLPLLTAAAVTFVAWLLYMKTVREK